MRDEYARSSAKLLIASGVVSIVGLSLPWINVSVFRESDVFQSGTPTREITYGISLASGSTLAVWIIVLSVIPLAVGILRQLPWKTMSNRIYRVVIPLAIANLVLLVLAWRHIHSYQMGFGTFFALTNLNAVTQISLGFWFVVAAQFAGVVAGVKTDLFYEKNHFGWLSHRRAMRRIRQQRRRNAGR